MIINVGSSSVIVVLHQDSETKEKRTRSRQYVH